MSPYIDKYVTRIIELLVQFAPRFIIAIIVLIVGLWLVKRVAGLAERTLVKREHDVSLRTFLKSLISIGLKLALFVCVAGIMGVGTTSFVTIMGAAGLALGLALQGSLANFAGGVLILVFKPFVVDDVIEAQGQTGTVTEIQIFNTILKTFDQRTVVLPNGVLSNNTIVNITRSGIHRIDIPLTLSTDNNIEKITSVIRPILQEHPLVMKDPAPQIVVSDIANGSINMNIKPYCNYDNSVELQSSLNGLMKEAFDKNNIKQYIPRA